jgi:hypothetical protein
MILAPLLGLAAAPMAWAVFRVAMLMLVNDDA